MAARKSGVLQAFIAAILGAGVSLSGVYFGWINLETDRNRFSLEFFDKYQKVMANENIDERAEWLRRLKRVHLDPPLVIIEAAINFTDNEIKEKKERVEAERLAAEAKEAARLVTEAIDEEARAVAARQAEAKAARIAAEAAAKLKAAAAAAAAVRVKATLSQIRRDSIYLGYDRLGRRKMIP